MFDYRESDVNARDPDSGRTPLHFAVENSDCEVVEQLLERGADVDVQDSGGTTPLHNAAISNASEVAELLLNRGADVNVQDVVGNTPLHNAASNNASSEAAEVLLDHGVDVNVQNNDGNTPLDLARRGDASETVELLLNRGAITSTQPKNRRVGVILGVIILLFLCFMIFVLVSP